MKAKPRNTVVKGYTKYTCPDRATHTDQPSTYTDFIDWAEKMSRTHKQEQCPTCGLFAMWVPRTTQGGEG